MSPLIATLAANGLSLLGNAVLAKGKAFVEDKLGVRLSEDMSPDQLVRLKELELEHEQFLLSIRQEENALGVELEKLQFADRTSARKMQETLSTSPSALQQNFTPLLATFLVVACFYGILFQESGEIRATCANIVLMIIGFYFGTNYSSKAKDATIKNLSEGGK